MGRVHGDTRHECPGGCGRKVTVDRYACRPCWSRLPNPLRVDIVTAWSKRNMGDAAAGAIAHRAAMSEAHRWFVTHPFDRPSGPTEPPGRYRA